MNSMQEDPTHHLEDLSVITDGAYDEKPGESVIETDIDDSPDIIPEREITDDDLLETGDRTDNVLMFRGAYGGLNLYPGDEITPDNVENLDVEWTWEIGGTRDFQNYPLIVDGDPPIMYITFGWDELYALNARNGDVLWSHVYEPAVGTGFSPSAERGAALYGDWVLKSTLDYGVIALDRYTGEEEWYYNGAAGYRGETAEDLMHEELQWGRSWGTTSSHPPLVYDGTVMKGSFGGEYGVSGFYDAIDLDGEPQWRVNMCPEGEWVGDSWKHGGGTAWASSCIDVENEQVVIPAANAGPWYGTVRPGWNPYTAGKVAVDIETGEYNWHHQDAPHDWWDYDSPSPAISYTAEVDGDERRLVSWAPKVGWIFTIDADTGKLVQRSDGYVQHVNMWSLPPKGSFDNAPPIMPTFQGGTNPQPSSFHPGSRTMVVSGYNSMARFSWNDTTYEAGSQYSGTDIQFVGEHPEYNGYGGVTAGVDPVSGDVKWQDWADGSVTNGTMCTAEGVSFSSRDQEFIGYDTDTGSELWSHDFDEGINGSPVAWEDPQEEKVHVVMSGDGTVICFSMDT